MNIMHWMKREDSGLATSTTEIVHYEERFGHAVCVKEPSTEEILYGTNGNIDVHCIHSQLAASAYHDGKPKVLWCHGEPLSSVANRISMKAILDMSSAVDAFICMRQDELPIWKSIKRSTYCIPKGIDLEVYKPLEGVEKLSGEPAVLYCENWRGDRNPLYLCVAMEQVFKKYPKARLHLYNCRDSKLFETFRALWHHNHWFTFLRSIQGPVEDINTLYNKADIVVSCLYPLYARSLEAFGAGKAFICPGYRELGYPYHCELHPDSIAHAIMKCWQEWGTFDFRQWAYERHDVAESTRQAIQVYERYVA